MYQDIKHGEKKIRLDVYTILIRMNEKDTHNNETGMVFEKKYSE